MNTLPKRDYRLEIMPIGGDTIIYRPPMQILFTITQSVTTQTITAEITIYGVSQSSGQLVQNYSREEGRFGSVTLAAGYQGNCSTIFSGVIGQVMVSRDEKGTFVKLSCNSHWHEWNQTRTPRSWGENTPKIEVLKDVAATFGLPVEIVGDFSDLKVYPRGNTLPNKLSRDFLNEMKNSWNYDWWFTTTKVVIMRKTAARSGIHEISAQNGMIGVPEWSGNALSQDKEKSDGAMTVKMTLNRQVQPGDLINIRSRFWSVKYTGAVTDKKSQGDTPTPLRSSDGKFKVSQVVYSGDFCGNNSWQTLITAAWFTS